MPCKDTEKPNPTAASLSKDRKEKILLNGSKALVVQTGGKIRKPYEMTQRHYLIHISCLERDCLLEWSPRYTIFLVLSLEEIYWKRDHVRFIVTVPSPVLKVSKSETNGKKKKTTTNPLSKKSRLSSQRKNRYHSRLPKPVLFKTLKC